jgi:hypothetical protein
MPDPTPLAAPAMRRLRLVSAVLLVTFCVVVAFITFWPGPPDPDGQRALRDFLRQAYTQGLPTWITFGKIEFGSNILMFVPIGLFGALTLGRAGWLIVPAAAAASAAIEIIQAARLPERVGTPRDVLANVLGALVGYLLAVLIVLGARRRTRRRGTDPAAPDPAAADPATRSAPVRAHRPPAAAAPVGGRSHAAPPLAAHPISGPASAPPLVAEN